MIRKLARPMLASVYIADGADTLLNAQAHVEGAQSVLNRVRTVLPRKYAKQLPEDPEVVTRTVGATKVVAGSLLATGKAPRTAATALAVASVPTILARHAFWETQDKEEKIARRQGFLTSVALLGGLAITSVDTAGKPGLKWRANDAAKRANKQIQQALPTKSETQKFAEAASGNVAAFGTQAKHWFEDASDKVAAYADDVQDYVNDNKDDWLETATEAAEQARSSFLKASDRASDFWKENSGEWRKEAEKNSKAAKKQATKFASVAQDRAEDLLKDWEKNSQAAKKQATKFAGVAQSRVEDLLDEWEKTSKSAKKQANRKAKRLDRKAHKWLKSAEKKGNKTSKRAQKRAAKLEKKAEKALKSAKKELAR